MSIIRAGILISNNIYTDDFAIEESVNKDLIDNSQYISPIKNYTEGIYNNKYYVYEV